MLSNVKNALSHAKTISDVDYIENRIEKSPNINRRTKAGRALTLELLGECYKKAHDLIDKGEMPFE